MIYIARVQASAVHAEGLAADDIIAREFATPVLTYAYCPSDRSPAAQLTRNLAQMLLAQAKPFRLDIDYSHEALMSLATISLDACSALALQADYIPDTSDAFWPNLEDNLALLREAIPPAEAPMPIPALPHWQYYLSQVGVRGVGVASPEQAKRLGFCLPPMTSLLDALGLALDSYNYVTLVRDIDGHIKIELPLPLPAFSYGGRTLVMLMSEGV